jgi:hypothetical protein
LRHIKRRLLFVPAFLLVLHQAHYLISPNSREHYIETAKRFCYSKLKRGRGRALPSFVCLWLRMAVFNVFKGEIIS